MKIKLNNQEYSYLNKILNDEISEKITILNADERFTIIEISRDIADDIREFISDQLQINGFDNNYELIQEGKIQEKLIDLFYIDQR